MGYMIPAIVRCKIWIPKSPGRFSRTGSIGQNQNTRFGLRKSDGRWNICVPFDMPLNVNRKKRAVKRCD